MGLGRKLGLRGPAPPARLSSSPGCPESQHSAGGGGPRVVAPTISASEVKRESSEGRLALASVVSEREGPAFEPLSWNWGGGIQGLEREGLCAGRLRAPPLGELVLLGRGLNSVVLKGPRLASP